MVPSDARYSVILLLAMTIWISTATELLYVLPDNSTNAVSCPSQPCATLSQYVLDNGTLPVVSMLNITSYQENIMFLLI